MTPDACLLGKETSMSDEARDSLPVTSELAAFALATEFAQLPASVVTKTIMCILDFLGVAAAASQMPWIRVVREYALEAGAQGPALVIGGGSLTPEFAALANATAGHGIELDDYHSGALAHPGCVAVPATLAIAQESGASGKEVITACAVGMETIVRLGLAAAPTMVVDRGFHETCVEGVFGSAACTGRLLRFDHEHQVAAFGIAGSHASGTQEFGRSGGEVKRLHAGLGASGGIRAARLAARGFTGPRRVLEGVKGIFHAFVPDPKPELLLDGLGTQWRILEMGVKPFANNALIHPATDALLTIMNEESLRAGDIASVDVGVDRLCLAHVGSLPLTPHDMNGAQFNLPYSLGIAMARGGNSFGDYLHLLRNGFDDPDVVKAGAKVRMSIDEEIDAAFPETLSARVKIMTVDNRAIERVGFARGSFRYPLTEREIRTKFDGLLATTPWTGARDKIAAAVLNLAEAESVSGILEPIAQLPTTEASS
jgi:2-methylcitrate dehydratase PrpD